MRIVFNADYRDDDNMFVTSPSIPGFSTVAPKGDWYLVFELLAAFVHVNGSQSVDPEQHYLPVQRRASNDAVQTLHAAGE